MALRVSFAIIVLTTVSAQKYPLNKHNIMQNNVYKFDFTYNKLPHGFTKGLTTQFSYLDYKEQKQNFLNIGAVKTMTPEAFSKAPYIMRYYSSRSDHSHKSKKKSKFSSIKKLSKESPRDYAIRKTHPRKPEQGAPTPDYTVNDVIKKLPLRFANIIRNKDPSPPAEPLNSDKDLYSSAESDNNYKGLMNAGKNYDSPAKSTKSLRYSSTKIVNTGRYNPRAKIVDFARTDTPIALDNSVYYESDNSVRDLYPLAELENSVRYGPQAKTVNNGRHRHILPLDDPDFDSDKDLFLTPEERPDTNDGQPKQDDNDGIERPADEISDSDRELFLTPEERPVSPGVSFGDENTELVNTPPEIKPADPIPNEDKPQETTFGPTTQYDAGKEHNSTEEYNKSKYNKNKKTPLTTQALDLPDITSVVKLEEKEIFPYIVAMMLEQKRKAFITVCSGSLITEFWVLVAAHCLHEDPKILLKGRIYYGNFSVASKSYRNIKKIVPFPNYYYGIEYAGPIKNDIGLVQLSSGIRRTICNSIARLSSIDYKVLTGFELRYALIESLRNWAPPLLPLGVITITGQLPEYAQSNATNMQRTDKVVAVKCPVDFLGPSICLHRQCRNMPLKVKPQDVGSPLLYQDKIVGICSGYSTYQTENRDEYVLRYTPVSPYLNWIYDEVTKKNRNGRRIMPGLRRFVYRGIPEPRPFVKVKSP